MNYKEKYEKAIVHLKKFLVGDCVIDQDILDDFPELKESEDERMMREFNDWLCEEIECRTNDLRDEKDRRTLNMLCYVLTKVRDWLEKQKPAWNEENERVRKWLVAQMQKFHDEANREGCWEDFCMTEKAIFYLEKQKESEKIHKPIEFKNDELVEIIKGEFEGFRRLLKKKGIDYEPQRGYWEGFARLFDSSAREYVKEQKEQKPHRFCDDTLEAIDKAREFDEQEKKPAEKQDYSGLTDFERAIHRGFLCAGVENVPVTIIKETAQDCLAHLPAEWSEEDDKTINDACEYLTRYGNACCNGVYEELGNKVFKVADRLKYLRPQPHWKPSEEQMKALDKAIPVCAGIAGKDGISPLISLYEELKKL